VSLLQLFRGDTFAFTRHVVDANGAPVDLSMADVTFTAKRRFRDAAFITKTIDDGGIDIGGSGDVGTLTVTLEPEDTDMLTHTERFVWDIQVDTGLEVLTPFAGRMVVALDVTHAGGSGS
jgi:hypothetical protein